MNGIYLNDIPIDLFLEYFLKEDLAKRQLEPVMENYSSAIDLFTITINDTDYYYKTSFTSQFVDNDDAIASITDDLNEAFLDIFQYGILNETYDFERDNLSSTSIYKNSVSGYVYPYKYRLTTSGNINHNFIEIINSQDVVIDDLASAITNVTLKDSRTNESIYAFNVDISSPVSGKHTVTQSNGTIVGYLYLNDNFELQKVTDNKYVYTDEFGNDTFTSYIDSNFLKHNNLMRVGINGLIDKKDLLFVSFNPSVIGLVKEGSRDKFELYETFTEKTTYTLQTEEPVSFLDDVIDRVLLGELSTTNTKEITNVSKFTKEILDLSKLPIIKTKIGSYSGDNRVSRMLSNYYPVSVNTGDTVIIEEYKERVSFRGSEYEFSSATAINYSGKITTVDINEFFNSFLLIPVSVLSSRYYVEIYENSSFKKYYFVKNTGAVNFELEERLDGAIYTMRNDKPEYANGYIKVPCAIRRYPEYTAQYLGTVVSFSSLNKTITISKYTPSSSIIPIKISEAFGIDTDDEEDEYVTTTYYRDILDRTKYLEVKKEIIRDVTDSPSRVPSYTEFFDWTHTVTPSAGFFTRQGTPYKKEVSRGSAIVTPLSLDDIKSNFSKFNHSVSDSYLSNRGNLVPSGIVYDLKTRLFGEMVKEYTGKKYTNFYAISNVIYSTENVMKMRIFTDGLLHLLSNDPEKLYPIPKRTEQLDYTDIDTKIVLSKREDIADSELIIGRDYDPNIGVGYASSEINGLNAFQKILDYNNFATDEERKRYLLRKYIRNYSYEDNDAVITIPDDIITYNRNPVKNRISKIEFKPRLIELLSGYYADFNNVPENNRYSSDYFTNLKPKIDRITPDTRETPVDEVTLKKIYSAEYLGENLEYERELIRDILSKEEGWEAL
jgi:hypothetical protein